MSTAEEHPHSPRGRGGDPAAASGSERREDPPRARTRESNQSLWWLTVSPLVWAAHFLCSYLTAALWIEKSGGRDAGLDPVRAAIAVYTVAALAGIGATLRWGWRRHRFGGGRVPHHDDTPEDRHRFLGFATVLLSALSAIATLFVALAAVLIKTTH